LRQVSAEQHRLEMERRSLHLGIRASQEECILEVALQRSLSLAHENATRRSAEESDVAAAIEHSIDALADAETSIAAEASALEQSVTQTAQRLAEQSLLDAAMRESTEMAHDDARRAAALDVSDAGAPTCGALGANAVRALEEGFSATEGLPPVETAAARRRSTSSAAELSARSRQASAAGEVQYRSDSIKRVYEAQHHFVLAQLTAPGIDAFLADDFSDDDDDEPATLGRSTSKFV
jgi:hypothetical protein